jgi:rRNA maturation endonuclease Nob1
MKPDPYILDTSVLSAYYDQSWLAGLEVHTPEKQIMCTQRVWDGEFSSEIADSDTFSWIDIEETTHQLLTEPSKALSDADLSNLALALEYDGTVVSNDKKVIETANTHDIHSYWGTEFLLLTVEECGVSDEEFEAGKQGYIEDVYLSKKAEKQLRKATKR